MKIEAACECKYLHDRVVGGLVNSGELAADEIRLEQHLRAAESLVSNGDDLSIGQFIIFLELGGLLRLVHLICKEKEQRQNEQSTDEHPRKEDE